MSFQWRKSDLILVVVSVAAGFYFFLSLGDLWPLAELDLFADSGTLKTTARSFLETRGFDPAEYRVESVLTVDEQSLEFLEDVWDRERVQRELAAGLPVFVYEVFLKRYGSAETFTVTIHPETGVSGFHREVRKDDTGGSLAREAARGRARHCLEQMPGRGFAGLKEIGYEKSEKPARTDHTFVFERLITAAPRAAVHTTVTVAGLDVVSVSRTVDLPSDVAEDRRRKTGREELLAAAGVAAAAAAVVLGFLLFLRCLREDRIELGAAGRCVTVIFVLSCLTVILRTAVMFRAWDPLWPWWIFVFRHVVYHGVGELFPLLLILIFIAAGDALDRREGWGRGESLRLLLRGRFASPPVALASLRGFFIGLLCGAALSGGVAILRLTGTVQVSLQPLGFFFYAINSAAPSFTTLFFFLKIAFMEELGYRFFGGTWLLSRTSRRWAAVAVPAVVYGLLHTGMRFLPPDEPFWGRAAVLCLVGCVWGWAFLNYDALTVVLSHFTADLFIFNWPRLASGRPELVTAAVLTILVPLLPALAGGIVRLFRRTNIAGETEASHSPARPADISLYKKT